MALHRGLGVCVFHLLCCLSCLFLCQVPPIFVWLRRVVMCHVIGLSGLCLNKSLLGLSNPILTVYVISRRSTLHQASTQPCYLLPTLSPGIPPGAHLRRVLTGTCRPAATNRPGCPPAPGTPSTPHRPACTPSVPGCSRTSIPTSGLTPAIPHPATASRSAAPQDSPAFQVLFSGIVFHGNTQD